MAAIYWRCFHCDAAFTKPQIKHAREHFGRDEGSEPVCLIRSSGEHAVLSALRKREDELAEYRNEDNDLLRAMWAIEADHAQALLREEEKGYARGLTDGMKERS